VKPIIIALTNAQLSAMEPVFDAADTMMKAGKPGIMMAQIIGDRMAVHVLDNAQGIAYQKLVGVRDEWIGKTMKETEAGK
jgi:hypothetical protein